jgi:hypothetical protein
MHKPPFLSLTDVTFSWADSSMPCLLVYHLSTSLHFRKVNDFLFPDIQHVL